VDEDAGPAGTTRIRQLKVANLDFTMKDMHG
jgi:hypothetical protein